MVRTTSSSTRLRSSSCSARPERSPASASSVDAVRPAAKMRTPRSRKDTIDGDRADDQAGDSRRVYRHQRPSQEPQGEHCGDRRDIRVEDADQPESTSGRHGGREERPDRTVRPRETAMSGPKSVRREKLLVGGLVGSVKLIVRL